MTRPTAGLVFPVGYYAGGTGGGGTSPVILAYQSNGDTNGLVNYLGTNGLSSAFANPNPSRLIGLMSSNIADSFPAFTGYGILQLTDRTDGLPAHTDAVTGSWIGLRLLNNGTINISDYTLKSRSDGNSNHPTSWVLEVSSNILANTVADWNAATWTVIDTRTAQSFTGVNEWKKFTVTGAIPANAWRIRQTGADSSNSSYLILGEMEVYGTLTTAGGGGSSLEPETTALLARFTGTYSLAAQTKIDTFIKAGKTDGWYQKLDGLWVVKSPTQSDALLNWISTSYPLVLEAGCTFTANNKIALQNVPGTPASVSTNYDPVVIGASAKYKQNDAFIGIYIQEDDPVNDESIIVTASGVTAILLDPVGNDTQMVLNANIGNVTVASAVVPNLYQVSRENTTVRGHVGTTTASTTLSSDGLGGGAFRIRETGSFRAIAVGGGLTAAQAISFKNALEAYLA